jgi:integrase/recombinase XerD
MGKITIRLELNSGKYVVLRFTRDRKYKKINIGVVSDRHSFNSERYGRWISKSDPEHERKNLIIGDKLQEAYKALNEIRNLRNAEPTLEEIDLRTRQGESYSDVLGYYKRLIDSFGNWNQQRAWTTGYNKLAQYLEHIGRKDIDFREIDSVWLGRFDAWMVSHNLCSGTRYTNFKKLRAAFNRGIADGLIPLEAYPFKRGGFKMPKTTQTIKQRLSIDELKAMVNVKLESKLQSDARDTFIAQFYLAGARIEDILRLKVENINNGRVEFVMKKTLQGRSYPMSEQLTALLTERISNREPNMYVFPWLDGFENSEEIPIKMAVSRKTAVVNKLLKKVAKRCSIDKPLTTHIARHSFAQTLVDNNVPVKLIQELLGHTSLAITEKYINSLNTSKADAIMNSLPTL